MVVLVLLTKQKFSKTEILSYPFDFENISTHMHKVFIAVEIWNVMDEFSFFLNYIVL